MRRAFIAAAVGVTLILGGGGVDAANISGYLNDTSSTALRGSLPDSGDAVFGLSGPLFGDDWDIANNVALHPLTLAAGTIQVKSNGFAAGGVDPYFTLFAGSGPGATFVGSNYVQAFSTGGDFDLTFTLDAGDYIFAVGAFANLSFAENSGSGTLGDGFTGLGGPDYLGTGKPYYYELEITTGATPVPEPATLLLVGCGATGALTRLRRRRR